MKPALWFVCLSVGGLLGCQDAAIVDSSPDAAVDAAPAPGIGGCPAGQVPHYNSPGCMAGDPPCGPQENLLCLEYACSCTGQLIGGCQGFAQPWAYRTDFERGCTGPFDASPETAAEAGLPTCSAGTVLVQPWTATSDFSPFCGQSCATTSDCPTDAHCVDMYNLADPAVGPVCVSTTVPPPVADTLPGWHWDIRTLCRDANTLAARYSEAINHVAGVELIHCPNGCADSVDGGFGAGCQ